MEKKVNIQDEEIEERLEMAQVAAADTRRCSGNHIGREA